MKNRCFNIGNPLFINVACPGFNEAYEANDLCGYLADDDDHSRGAMEMGWGSG